MIKPENINCVAEKLKTQNEVAFLTLGESMKPLFLTHRDIAVITKPVFPLKKGDVVLYNYSGSDEMILHRIVKIKGCRTYIIRGDNTYKNELVKQDAIIGVLKAFIRKNTYFDCKKSVPYKMYVGVMQISYPIRFVFHHLHLFLWKTKNKILKRTV